MLGDSITAGYGLAAAQAYPALLQQKIDAAGWLFAVANAGVSGDTTAGGARRIAWAIRQKADVLILALGANDGLRGVPPAQTAANLAAIIRKARELSPGISIILAGMQMPGGMGREFVEQYRAIFPRVAEDNGAALVPYRLEGVGGIPAMNQPDYIHPNAEGQQRIATTVWPVLEKVLTDRRTATAAP